MMTMDFTHCRALSARKFLHCQHKSLLVAKTSQRLRVSQVLNFAAGTHQRERASWRLVAVMKQTPLPHPGDTQDGCEFAASVPRNVSFSQKSLLAQSLN
jgi:hypothetical protein